MTKKKAQKKAEEAEAEKKKNESNLLASFVHKLSQTSFDTAPKDLETYYYDSTFDPSANTETAPSGKRATVLLHKSKKPEELFLVARCDANVLVVKVQKDPIHEHFVSAGSLPDAEISKDVHFPDKSFFFYLVSLYQEAVETLLLSPFPEQWGQKSINKSGQKSTNKSGWFEWAWSFFSKTSVLKLADLPDKTAKYINQKLVVNEEITEPTFLLKFDEDVEVLNESSLIDSGLLITGYKCCSCAVVDQRGTVNQKTRFILRDFSDPAEWHTFDWSWTKKQGNKSATLIFRLTEYPREATLLISKKCDPGSAFKETTKKFLDNTSKDMFATPLLFTSPKIHFGLMTTSPAHVIAVPEITLGNRLVGSYLDVGKTTYNEVIFKALETVDYNEPCIVSHGLTTFPYIFSPTCSFVGCIVFNANANPRVRMVHVTGTDAYGMQQVLEDGELIKPADYKTYFLKGKLKKDDEWIIQFYKTDPDNHLVFRVNVFLSSQKGFVP